MDRAFRRLIAVDLARADLERADRANVDHGGGALGARPGAEQREQLLEQEEWRFEVEIDHVVPLILGEVVERGVAERPGVVDEDVQRWFARGQFGDQRLDSGERRDVRRDSGDIACDLRRSPGDFVRPARTDVHPRARRSEAGGDHPADPGAAPGDQRDPALDRKQPGGIHHPAIFRIRSVTPSGSPTTNAWSPG